MIPLSIFGIGSIPFAEGEDFCEKIFERWDIPFWPQYPGRSCRENFVFQFLNSFPGLEVSSESAVFEEATYLEGAGLFREKLDQAFRKRSYSSFEPSSEWALGYSQMVALLEKGGFPDKRIVKLQITGPATIWKSFFEGRVSKKSARQIWQDLCQTLAAAGLAQIRRVAAVGRTPLILIDEPLRSNFSALEGMIEHFKREGAWVGLHNCSSSAWEDLERLKLDLFHFSLTAHSELGPPRCVTLQTLLRQGCWIGWGIIPTVPDTGFRAQDFSGFLLKQLRRVSTKGLSIDEILQHSLIAPACGTGTLGIAQDLEIYRSAQLSQETLRYQAGKLGSNKAIAPVRRG